MKTRWLLMLGGIVLLLSVAATNGHAAGTPAGTAIANQAQVQYLAGTASRSAVSNATLLYVAHRVAGAFNPGSGAAVGVDSRTVYYATQFRNTGNRADNFNITFNTNAGYTVDMFRDVNMNGAFDAGDVLITSTGNLAADADIWLLMRVQVAASRPDNETVTVTATLTSTAANDNGNNIVVANPGAVFTYNGTYTVNRPVIAFTATQSAVVSNASRIPGANVTYTMSLQNTGTGSVSGNSTVTFQLDPHFHFVSATNSGVLSGPDGNGNGGIVTWTVPAAQLATGAPANAYEVVVQPEQVTNNGTGVTAGTNVYAMSTANTTQTRVQFNDGVNNYSQDNANNFTFAVGRASGVVIAQVTPDGAGEPGSQVEYHYTLKNTGNAADGYDFTQANDGSGNLDVAHIFSQTANGASITSLAAIAQGATADFYVRVTVPLAATDGQTIKRNLTATTQTASPTAPTGGSTSSTDNLTTSALAASVTIAVAAPELVSGAVGSNVVPGTVVRYTVTIANVGSAPASNVVASDVNPHLTADQIVGTSINIDANGDDTYELTGVPLPYNSGGIQASIAGGVLTTQFTSIPGGKYVKYQYNVAVQ